MPVKYGFVPVKGRQYLNVGQGKPTLYYICRSAFSMRYLMQKTVLYTEPLFLQPSSTKKA